MSRLTYKSRFTMANGSLGRFFFMLCKLSLRLMGMREEPGMVIKIQCLGDTKTRKRWTGTKLSRKDERGEEICQYQSLEDRRLGGDNGYLGLSFISTIYCTLGDSAVWSGDRGRVCQSSSSAPKLSVYSLS